MKLYFPSFDEVISFDENIINSIIIENQNEFRKIIKDFLIQIDESKDGECILSEKDKVISMSKYCDIISEFANFKINRKELVNAFISKMDNMAKDEIYFEKSMQLISLIEKFINEISDDLGCETLSPKLSILSLFKASGVEIEEEYDSMAEKILDYMELMMDNCHKKLFITINMRNYFDDKTMQLFANSLIAHKINVLMIEAHPYPILEFEKRITVDSELCIF